MYIIKNIFGITFLKNLKYEKNYGFENTPIYTK
jgi:hypothetical protein